MILEEKIKELYNLDLESRILIDKEKLDIIGFNEDEIEKLIELEIISKLEGYYIFKYQKLYEYGMHCLEIKRYDLFVKCFLRCYFLNQKNKDCLLTMFKECLNTNDIEIICLCFYTFLNTVEIISNNYILIIYLLSKLTDLPQKYKIILENYDKQNTNAIEAIKNNNFDLVLEYINNLDNNFLLEVLKRLAVKAKIKIYPNKFDIYQMIKRKNYQDVIDYLENTKLNAREEHILKLIKDIVYMIDTKEIPKVKALNAYDIYDAIDKKLFDKAVEYNNKFNKDIIIDICLKEITSLTNEIIKNKRITLNNQKNNKYNIILTKLYEKLDKNELDEQFYSLLDEYLFYFKLNRYKFVFLNMIKIDTLYNDLTYFRVKNFLKNISDKHFTFNIRYYVNQFNIYINSNLKIAGIYLDIIEKIKKVDNLNINTKYLNQSLFYNIKRNLNKYKYNVGSIENLINYVNKLEDIDYVIRKYSLDKYEENILKLLLAKKYYESFDIDKGDYLLGLVENSEFANNVILNLLEEIEKSKPICIKKLKAL